MSAHQPITPQEALQRVIEHREIFHDEMLHIMRLIMSGEMSPVLMSAFIAALRVKKETIGEITAAAQVMREFSTKVEVVDRTHMVDIVGTGGDGGGGRCAPGVARGGAGNFDQLREMEVPTAASIIEVRSVLPKIPIIATTIINSIKVKPCFCRENINTRFFFIIL